MNPQNLPKGAGAAEVPGNQKPANDPGVYTHAASGKSVIVMPDAQSTGQQDALVRMGFTKTAEPPTRSELTSMQQKQADDDEKNGVNKVVSSASFGSYNPDAPRFNTTSSVTDSTSNPNNVNPVGSNNEEVAAALARADAAEAELASLKASQSTLEGAGEEETSGEDSTDTTGEDSTDTQTNATEGTK